MSKSKTKTESKTNVVTTPTNPTWVTDSVSGLQDKINGLLTTDASTLVPGASGLQTQAFGAAANMGGWKPGNAQAQEGARSLMGSTTTPIKTDGRSLLDVDLAGYENPWIDSVVSTSLGSFDENAGMKRAELAAQQARGQKFSGSGDAITKSLFERGSDRDRAGIETNLRAQGFDRATELANRDLDRLTQNDQFNAVQGNTMSVADRDAQLRAAGLLGDLANSGAVNERADIGLLSDQGVQQRTIEREKLGANVELLKLISALNSGQPYGLFQGQESNGTQSGTTTQSGGLAGMLGPLGGLLGGAGSIMSGFGALRAGGAG